MGWAPALTTERAAQGIRLDQTIGQNLNVIDPKRKHVVVFEPSAVLLSQRGGENQSIATRLRSTLTEHQVLDATVLGYGLDQIYLYLQLILPRLNPTALVIELTVPQDQEPHRTTQFMGINKPLFDVNDDALVHINPKLQRHGCINHFSESLFFSFLWKRAMRGDGMKGRASVARTLGKFCRAPVLSRQRGREVLSRLLDKIQLLGKERGVPVIFVLTPHCGGAERCQTTLYERPAWFQPQPWLPFFRSIVLRRGWAHVDASRALDYNDCAPDSSGVLECERKRPFHPRYAMAQRIREIVNSGVQKILAANNIR
jgi:hypothetical protein